MLMWPEGWQGETGRALTMGRTLDLLLSEMRHHSDCCVEKRARRVKGKSNEAVTQARENGHCTRVMGMGRSGQILNIF